MDQQRLREWEHQCIQEEAPWCQAECPLHVDVRGFIRFAGRNQWADARKILDKTQPLAGILGRICDHPCEDRCKRREAGGAISIGALERAVVTRAASRLKVKPLPGRGKRVMVTGGGLSSLTVAWDLARKGYDVRIATSRDRLGGNLLDMDPALLPAEVIAEETDVLKGLHVGVLLKTPLDPETFAGLRQDSDAVYIGMDGGGVPDPGLEFAAVPPSMATPQEGVYAGGFPREDGRSSPIWNAAEGRFAATSIDRFLQNVSPTAGREKEGPYETRLYTSIYGIAPSSQVAPADPEAGYTDDEAVAEARRCLQCECLECVKICPYLEHFRSYPRQYARQIYNNAAIVKGERKANILVNTCSYCRLCETVCPEDFSMADLCRGARSEMISADRMPPSAHEFALDDMAFSNSPACSLARHAPGRTAGTHLFFPGCQLGASSPSHVERVYDYLRGRLGGDVGLMLRCCGAPADWAGRQDLFESNLGTIRTLWEGLGRPAAVLACTSCLDVFRRHLPDIAAVSLWEVMVDRGLPDDAFLKPTDPVAVADPCTARRDGHVQAAVRELLGRMGVAVDELHLAGSLTECCGYGGLMSNANPAVAREVIRRRAGQSPRDYLAYCVMCRDHLAAAGKRAVHLLDLIWPPDPDPASRRDPGYTLRHENRTRLKERLLKTLWEEATDPQPDFETIPLAVSPELRERLEGRRILDEDLRRVIHAANTSRAGRFRDPATGRFLACHRPRKVTFWVEYTPSEDGGYTLHNAYCHRMEIEGAASDARETDAAEKGDARP
ncbi:pyridine nucleotide-disulfide oxidoreductase/dicluster-binding protein [Desulfococcus sp.]|uniref:pyridine nucleotide-disulfide oxidoreductase/dicluster-binding protein n=1 Tax=Desulfococcus sp. TaxID=2025834 RepID=UPI003593F90E